MTKHTQQTTVAGDGAEDGPHAAEDQHCGGNLAVADLVRLTGAGNPGSSQSAGEESPMSDTTSYLERLSPAMRRELDDIAVSWKMEDQELTGGELEILARFMLGEISREECARLMRSA